MLAAILLHIITLKTAYSDESHHYGDCNKTLTSHASKLPIPRKVKPEIQNYEVYLWVQLPLSFIIFHLRLWTNEALCSYWLNFDFHENFMERHQMWWVSSIYKT